MGLFSATKTPKGQKKKRHKYSHGREDAGATAATGPTAAERHAEEAQYKGRGRARW